jgi:basic amino acid/polyamine antiporter, APA family
MTKLNSPGYTPVPTFSIFSAVAVTVGIVVGIGIVRIPPLVAENSATGMQYILFWLAGGVISFLGALCYAELASSKPDTGGEYHYLSRAFGPPIGFIFSWGRMTVIQTGSIALIAFIFGDYAALLLDIGPHSSSIFAVTAVIVLTGLNMMGTNHSRRAQNILTTTILLTLILLSISGLSSLSTGKVTDTLSTATEDGTFTGGAAGMAMIFVLITYGGWNEASYLTGEIFNVRRRIIWVLVIGISLITGLYILVNYTYLHVLGLETLRNSQTVGADLTERILGPSGSLIVTLIVTAAALSTANATIITGARTNYALGRDFKIMKFLGQWNGKRNTPVNALLVQGAITLVLLGLGIRSKESVSTMVDYTAPVFWFFLLLTTATLFIFRYRQPNQSNTYRVPLFPFTPILFMLVCVYMLYSSVVFTGIGATFGVGVLMLGILVYLFRQKLHRSRV